MEWRSGNLTMRRLDPPFTRPDIEEIDEEVEEPQSTAYQPVGSAPPPSTQTNQVTSSPPQAAAAPRRSTYDNSDMNSSPFADSNHWSTTTTTNPPGTTVYSNNAPRTSGYATPPAAASRPSLDAYGAFSDPAPSGFGGVSSSFTSSPAGDSNAPRISRTMQYADPYAAVRASLAATGHTAPPSYDSYSGYR